MTNTYCVYTVFRYSWWWTVDMSETCKSTLSNKFEKYCISLAFIIRLIRSFGGTWAWSKGFFFTLYKSNDTSKKYENIPHSRIPVIVPASPLPFRQHYFQVGFRHFIWPTGELEDAEDGVGYLVTITDRKGYLDVDWYAYEDTRIFLAINSSNVKRRVSLTRTYQLWSY